MISYYIEPKVIPNFITDEEIDCIMKKVVGEMVSSRVNITGDMISNVRKSENGFIHHTDTISEKIYSKCAHFLGKPKVYAEGLHIVHYNVDGFYVPHQDSEEGGLTRINTFILALNDDYEGGETEFPNLNMKFKLKKGDALFFHTRDSIGLVTSNALHAGLPVKSGEKWICNVWIHKTDIGT
jgi:prolyl 4-hydroxylase